MMELDPVVIWWLHHARLAKPFSINGMIKDDRLIPLSAEKFALAKFEQISEAAFGLKWTTANEHEAWYEAGSPLSPLCTIDLFLKN